MAETTLMTDAATTTEGAPESSSAAPVETQAQAGAEASAAQEQQATEGTDSTEGTNHPAEEKPDGTQEGEEAKAEGAPENYEFQTPEGLVVDDQAVKAFSEVAKELNMPQEAAQKILDKVAPVMAQRQAEALTALSNSWVESVRADKEIGGEQLAENLAVANKAITAFGTPELRALLNESRLGNHPEVIRFMLRAGKAISEDGKHVSGNTARPISGARDAAKSLYPDQQT